jgi:uncharacterized membrane protein
MQMRAIRLILAAAAWTLVAVLAPVPSFAQAGVDISTDYPGVAIGPGESATFDLEVTGPGGTRVSLRVTGKPQGWGATLRGGGFVVEDVVVQSGGGSPDVQLDVDVPPDARPGVYHVEVRATSNAGSDTLSLDLRVAAGAEGGVELATEFPTLQGAATDTFSFDVLLSNNSPGETRFSLETFGPEGWVIDATLTGQQQASTVTVAGGSTADVAVEADPPDDVVAGDYLIGVQAVGGGATAQLELGIQITGNFALTLTTPDERLSTEVTSGGSTDVEFLLINDGTAPLVGITLSGTPPADWEVVFTPEAVDQVPAGETASVIATITPAGDALAGDYVVSVSASAPEVSADLELRTTVTTSGLWGVVGILLIVAALAGLGWVFRRYGRR